ncbi:MAG: sugar phosphate isomerase/epimerase family protein [Rubrobacter sp.]
MKIALRDGMTPGETLPERLAWLERVGLDGIELEDRSLDLQAEELRAIFADSPVSAANVPGSGALIDPDPKERAAARELTSRRLHLAGELGAVGVLVVPQFGSAPRLNDLSPYKTASELERELFALQLEELAPAASQAGVPIFLEPLNRYEQHLVNRLEQGVAFAERARSGVGIMADFFHMNIEEADIAASIRAAGPHIVYVHVADSNRLQPGRGHLDFSPGFAALKEVGYDGYLGIECGIEGPYEESLAESAALLRELWDTA